MNIREFVQAVRARWRTICSAIVIATLGAVVLTLLTTPLYEASTRLFVSTTTIGKSPYEAYQGTQFTQQRVITYIKLITGEAVAQRTVDRLHLDMSAATLQAKVRVTSADTASIDISVRDPSPLQARDIADGLSDEFVAMATELEAPAGGDGRDARVVVQERASIPTSPVVPQAPLNIAVGLVLGALLGTGFAVLRHRLDKTVEDPHLVEEITGVGPVIRIPFEENLHKSPILSFADAGSAITEAFRKVRTNILFGGDDRPRVILVTSSLPNEGKSITAINVALALASVGRTVVLVDGDMRQPKLAYYLASAETIGFSTVLTESALLHGALQATQFLGLKVITSGPVVPNPSELLSSNATRAILDDLRSVFDYVILDSSALLPVTDAAALAAEADGVLIIARFASTGRDDLANAVQTLRNVDARIITTILTMTPAPKKARSKYGVSSDRRGGADTHAAEQGRRRQRKQGRHANAGPRSESV